MAFDPDAYLAGTTTKEPPVEESSFDPDAYLAGETATPVAAPKLKRKPLVEEEPSAALSHARTFAETLPAASAGLVGFGAGMKSGAALGALTGPAAPIMIPTLAVGGGLTAAFIASGAATKVANWVHEAFAPEDYKQRQETKAKYPYGTFAAQTLANLAGMSPKAVPEVAGKLLTKPWAQRGVSAVFSGGIEAGSQIATEGKLDAPKIAMATAAGVAMPSLNPLGLKAFSLGERMVAPILPKDSPSTGWGSNPYKEPSGEAPQTDAPTTGKKSTVKGKPLDIGRLQKLSEERDSLSPLVQAVIRNKTTGNIEYMGPKHDPARLAETQETHDVGFVTERGKFLSRYDSWAQAQRTGQIPKNHTPVDPSANGLRSEDLRVAGDERFKLPEGAEVPPTEAPPIDEAPTTPKAPTTREEFKKAIDDAQYREAVDLELQAEEAIRNGDYKVLDQIRAEQKLLTEQSTQMLKDLPEPTVANKERVTWEELQDITWRADTIEQAFKLIQKSGIGTKANKALLNALKRSKPAMATKLTFTKEGIPFQELDGSWRDAPAVFKHGTAEVVSGKGADLTTFLHETVHAATHESVIGNSPSAKRLRELLDTHKEGLLEEADLVMARFTKKHPKATISQIKAMRDYIEYGIKDADEFIAEAFTNKDFQGILKNLPSTSQKPQSKFVNAWEEFKSAVAEALNIPAGAARSALDDVLETGIKLVEGQSQRSSRGVISNKTDDTLVSPSRESSRIHDELGQDGIPVAHTTHFKFGEFNWEANALKGEGGAAKGVGTYHSTADGTNNFYVQGAKDRLVKAKTDAALDDWQAKVKKLEELSDAQQSNAIKLEALNKKAAAEGRKPNSSLEYWALIKEINTLDGQHKKATADVEAAAQKHKDLYNESPENLNTIVQNKATRVEVLTRRKVDLQQQLGLKYGTKDAEINTELEQIEKQLLRAHEELFSAKEAYQKVVAENKVPTYHSTIKAKTEELIDWDATQQSDLVNKAFNKLGIRTSGQKLIEWGDGNSVDLMDSVTNNVVATVERVPGVNNTSLYEATAFDAPPSYKPGKREVFESKADAIAWVHKYLDTSDANATGADLYKKLGKQLEPTGREALELMPEDKKRFGFVHPRVLEHFQKFLGQARASKALREEGVVGNVHNASGGKDDKYRNYVTFDDSRVRINAVTFAARSKPNIDVPIVNPETVRPVTIDDTVPPKYLYHGTRNKVEIDADGNLVLKPAKNFGGKTNSVSLTHNRDYAEDYATRVKGGGSDGIQFEGAKTIKLHSDALPEGISRENGEEWAFNTNDPVIIPKGKYEIIEHSLSEPKDGFTYDFFSEWGTDRYGENGFDTAIGEGREGQLRREWLEEMADPDITPDLELNTLATEQLKEMDRLQEVTRQRMSGEYQEPSVQWNKPSTGKASAASTKPEEPKPTVPKVDRTKTDPRDVQSEEEFYEIATDIFEKHGEVDAVKFYEGYQEYQKTWLQPFKEFVKYTGINIKNKLATARIIHNIKADMIAEVPSLKSRERIAVAVDSGNTTSLNPAELALANKYSKLVADIGNRAVEKGVVKGLLEDYVTHIIEWEGAPKGAKEEFLEVLLGTKRRDPTMQGMTLTSKFAKERKLKTFTDLQEYIDLANARIEAAGKTEWRLKIKTLDIAELYKEYATSMEKAIENKTLVDTLKQIRNVFGETLIRQVDKDNPLPPGWEMMDGPQFGGNAIHPDFKPIIKFVFDAGPGELAKGLGWASQFTKRMNVIASFFHAKSLMEVLSSTGIPIWTPVKEVALGGVDKLLGTKYSGLTKALEQFHKGGLGDNVDTWIKDGLMLEVPEDVSTGVISATGKFADEMIGKFAPYSGRVLERSLSAVERNTLGHVDKFTWDFLHTGGKLMTADALLDKARLQAASKGLPFDEPAVRKQIASFINDSFGGLNWFDAATQTRTEFGKRMAMAAYSPAGRRGLQMLLFAPDWTISTIRAFSAALPSQLNPAKWHPIKGVEGMMTPTTKADYARLYQFKTALTYLTLINAINLITADRPIWENKDPTRIEWPDGTSMQAMKHAMEPYHWMFDPVKTLGNKLGFLPKAAIISTTGVEYASPTAPKLVENTAVGRAWQVAKMAAPFQLQAANAAPEGEGVKRALYGTLGVPMYGSTDAQKKISRAERSLREKERTWEYHEKEIDAGREKWTMEHSKRGKSLKNQRRKLEREGNK